MSDSPEDNASEAPVPARKSKWKAVLPAILSNSSLAYTQAVPVFKSEEIGRVVDLGLGRGVDITDPTPWLCKSSFQVRPVTVYNIIGTEEGGSLQSYDQEIESLYSNQMELKSSVTAPQSQTKIGIDAELSRSTTMTRRALGRKVVNRTISFRSDFDDAPYSATNDPAMAKQHSIEVVPSSFGHLTPIPSHSGVMTFEERLCKWILERESHRKEVKELLKEGKRINCPKLDSPGDNPVQTVAALIYNCDHEERKMIMKDCSDFVHYFHVTHYVSAVELGASEYRVMTEEEYHLQVMARGTFGSEKIVSASAKETISRKYRKKSSEMKRIGIIKLDGTVERGTYGEAVVGILIQPVTNLITFRYLQLAMQKALVDYVEERADSAAGPFLIACNNDKTFLSVNANKGDAIEGTNIHQASKFFVIQDDGSHPYEFTIAYFGRSTDRKFRRSSSMFGISLNQPVSPVAQFLSAPVNVLGQNHGPLRVQHQVSATDARLMLYSRLRRGHFPVQTTSWVQGRDIFYIGCARRGRLHMKSYICVQLKQQVGSASYMYTTTCISSPSSHNGKDRFMLFRLLPANAAQIEEEDVPALPSFKDLNERLRRRSERRKTSQSADFVRKSATDIDRL